MIRIKYFKPKWLMCLLLLVVGALPALGQDTVRIDGSYQPTINSSTNWIDWKSSGVYIVTENVTINKRVDLGSNKTVKLVLSPGTTLHVSGGFEVGSNVAFTIEGEGSLLIDGCSYNWAGIGSYNPNGSTLTINSGNIDVTGGNYSAGIGGSMGNVLGMKVVINGGKVKATGLRYGAAIGGGGASDPKKQNCGVACDVEINGGQVTAIQNSGHYAIGWGNVMDNVNKDVAAKNTGSLKLGWTNKNDYIYCSSFATNNVTFTKRLYLYLSDREIATVENSQGRKLVASSGTSGDPYEIQNMDDWNALASQSSKGYQTVAHIFHLKTDLNGVHSTVGTREHPFKGSFKGEGHTITVDLNLDEDTCGLFRYTQNAHFYDLRVAGKMNVKDKKFSGGFVGQITDTTSFERCMSDVTTTATLSEATDVYHGGFVGYAAQGTINFTDCHSNWQLEADNAKKCGTFIGLCNMYSNNPDYKFKNCYYSGYSSQTADDDKDIYYSQFATMVNGLPLDEHYENCHATLTNNTRSYVDKVIAKYDRYGVKIHLIESVYSGEAAHALGSAWGQDLSTGRETLWLTTLKPDVPRVYQASYMDSLYLNPVKSVWTNKYLHIEQSKPGNYAGKYWIDGREVSGYITLTHDVKIRTTYQLSGLVTPYGEEGIYYIASREDWENFANYVSQGHPKTNAFLCNDVDVSRSEEESVMVGDGNEYFEGTFDGQGFTLTFKLHMKEDIAGPFRRVENATIKNLKVKGTIRDNHYNYAGGLVGVVPHRGLTIINCQSEMVFEGWNITLGHKNTSNECYHGGFVGQTNANTEIKYCVSKAQFNGPGKEGEDPLVGGMRDICGFVGSFSSNSVTISNCISDCDAPGSIDRTAWKKLNTTGAFAPDKDGLTLNNCYYTNDLWDHEKEQGTKIDVNAKKEEWIALQKGSDKEYYVIEQGAEADYPVLKTWATADSIRVAEDPGGWVTYYNDEAWVVPDGTEAFLVNDILYAASIYVFRQKYLYQPGDTVPAGSAVLINAKKGDYILKFAHHAGLDAVTDNLLHYSTEPYLGYTYDIYYGGFVKHLPPSFYVWDRYHFVQLYPQPYTNNVYRLYFESDLKSVLLNKGVFTLPSGQSADIVQGDLYRDSPTPKLQLAARVTIDNVLYWVLKDDNGLSLDLVNTDIPSTVVNMELNGRKQTDYDQSNWVLLQCPDMMKEDGYSFFQYVYKIKNPQMDVEPTTGLYRISFSTDGTMVNLDSGTRNWKDYVPNAYCPANFYDKNLQPCTYDRGDGSAVLQKEFFFMPPKEGEYAYIVNAVYAGTTEKGYLQFYQPLSPQYNPFKVKGGFRVDLSLDHETDLSKLGLEYGKAYNFSGLIGKFRKVITPEEGSDARRKASEFPTYGPLVDGGLNTKFVVYAFDLSSDKVTETTSESISNPAKQVQSVSYYNLTGQMSTHPFEGVNIVVTRFTDGTMESKKVLK